MTAKVHVWGLAKVIVKDHVEGHAVEDAKTLVTQCVEIHVVELVE